MADPANTGIYEIVNRANGKRYIGSAIHFRKRWRSHISDLRLNRHHCRALQRAWFKYGPDNFEFRVLEYCAPASLIPREQAAFDQLKPEYNTCKVAGSMAGVSPSIETRQKIAKALANRTFSDETRARISAALRGKPHGPEVYAKIAAKNRGRRPTDETRRKLSTARAGRKPSLGMKHSAATRVAMSKRMKESPPFLGRRHTEEARAKISAARVGNGHPDSDVTKAKKSLRMTGNKIWLGRSHSASTKRILSEMFKGRVVSKETRRRMAEAQRQRAPISDETRSKMSAGRTGIRNASAIKRVFTIENRDGIRISGIPIDLRSQTQISAAAMSQLISGYQKSAKGWRLVA